MRLKFLAIEGVGNLSLVFGDRGIDSCNTRLGIMASTKRLKLFTLYLSLNSGQDSPQLGGHSLNSCFTICIIAVFCYLLIIVKR